MMARTRCLLSDTQTVGLSPALNESENGRNGAVWMLTACAGTSKNHKDAASVRTTHPIPASCGVYYFEVKVVSKGRDGQVFIVIFHESKIVLLRPLLIFGIPHWFGRKLKICST